MIKSTRYDGLIGFRSSKKNFYILEKLYDNSENIMETMTIEILKPNFCLLYNFNHVSKQTIDKMIEKFSNCFLSITSNDITVFYRMYKTPDFGDISHLSTLLNIIQNYETMFKVEVSIDG